VRSATVVLLLLLLACKPLPPSTPPLPSTPPPPPEERIVASAAVTGRVVDVGGRMISHAAVLVRSADAGCNPVGPEVGAFTDQSAEFFAKAEWRDASPFTGCVVVEARSGGATGTASEPVRFSTDSPPARIDVRLDAPPPLTLGEAERLAKSLATAINDPARADADLNYYVLHGPEALRVALEQYRTILGRVASVAPVASDFYDPRRFTFELRGENGRTSRIDVYQENLTRIHSPLIDYGFRSEGFIHAYLRSIQSGDAERLARVLNPDDIDFPVERAREMIVDYRTRYRDTATIRAEFVDVDEKRHSITWRLRGTARSGEEITETIVLGFGDGLIGIRGLNP
jgi:hypothetical protein